MDLPWRRSGDQRNEVQPYARGRDKKRFYEIYLESPRVIPLLSVNRSDSIESRIDCNFRWPYYCFVDILFLLVPSSMLLLREGYVFSIAFAKEL